MPRVKVGIILSDELHGKVKEIARSEKRSMSAQIEKFIEDYVADRERVQSGSTQIDIEALGRRVAK